jgi:hypothetical protein
VLRQLSTPFDWCRAGAIDVHDVDEVIHRYHKATQGLWKFCFRGGSGAYAETVAGTLEHPDRGGRAAGLVGGSGAPATWLSPCWLPIKVELLSGHDVVLDHPAGRVMIASPSHMLAELAEPSMLLRALGPLAPPRVQIP